MRFPLPLPHNTSDRPRGHVGRHRRPHRAWRRFGAVGVLAWALAVLVGLGGCGPSDPGSAPSSSPAAVASPSDSPSDSPTPTAAAAQPAPTTAAPVAVPTAQAAAPQAAAPTTPAAQQQQQQSTCGGDYYINSDGNCVHRPVQAPGPPAGATAKCNDGTWSFSQHRSGTCSGHGGVAEWL